MIYFIQEIGLFRNRVKIGFTDNIKGRLSGMRSSSPSLLKVLLVLPGDIQTEITYHERFYKYRLHGEWFKYGIKLRLFIWLNQFKHFVIETELSKPTNNELEFNIVTSNPDPDPDPVSPAEPPAEEMVIIEAVKKVELECGKMVWSAVTNELGWTTGGSNNDRIKAVLDKWNIIYPMAKHDPANVNAAIDELLAADPKTFPSKGEVANAVGVTGGARYKTVIETYQQRLTEWDIETMKKHELIGQYKLL